MNSERSMSGSTGYLFSLVCKLRRARGSALMEEIGIHRGQPHVLACLWEREGLTHSELAEQLYVRPATITNTLKRMEKQGLLQRRPDPDDQRVSRVFLTDAGRQIRSQVEAVWQRLEALSFAGLSADEVTELRRLLTKIKANLAARA